MEQVKKRSIFREYLEAIIIALLLALFVRTFVVQAFKIPSGSMMPTLKIGDHILVNKFIYGVKIPFSGIDLIPISKPKRGDIIVFKFPEDERRDFIKRVIAVEGDKIEIKDTAVYVNDTLLNETYVMQKGQSVVSEVFEPRDHIGALTVPEGKVFVMGDNRDHSYDSRYWGFVDIKKIKGKAFIIYWSWDGNNHWVRWKRIGRLID